MSIADIMEKELRPISDESAVRVVKREPAVRVVNKGTTRPVEGELVYTADVYVPSTRASRIRKNTPSRYELNVMRRRIDRHKRWIQLGILIGAIGVGSKVPTIVDWYHGDVSESVVAAYTPPAREVKELQDMVVQLEDRVEEHVSSHVAEPVEVRATYVPRKAVIPARVSKTVVLAPRHRKPVKTTYHEQKTYAPTSPPTKTSSVAIPKMVTSQTTSPTYIPKQEVTRTFAQASPREICVSIPARRCYSGKARGKDGWRERQVYRRLEKRLRDQ